MSPVQPEFRRPFALAGLGRDPVRRVLEATASERAALVRRLDLLGLDRLHAEIDLRRQGAGDAVVVSGHFEAEVTQSCVVTLDPVRAQVAETFTVRYAPDLAETEEVDVDPLEGDVERLEGDVIDLGELVTQHLSLALDPYPRAPGVAFEPPEADDEAAVGGPFAALERLRRRS